MEIKTSNKWILKLTIKVSLLRLTIDFTLYFRMEQKLRQEMKEVVKEELAEALKDQQHTISDNVIQCLRSGAVTPRTNVGNTRSCGTTSSHYDAVTTRATE